MSYRSRPPAAAAEEAPGPRRGTQQQCALALWPDMSNEWWFVKNTIGKQVPTASRNERDRAAGL